MLSDTQIERYSRQIILPQVGGRGQLALLAATLHICGSNEMAATAALYLAAAGVGHLHVAPATAAAIEGVNPDCHIVLDDGGEPASGVVHAAAVLCAGTGAAMCAVMNTACVHLRVPMIVGAAAGDRGWMSLCAGFAPAAPCYRCLSQRLASTFRSNAALAPVPPPLGNVTAGFIGTLLATEAMKHVLALPTCAGRLITFDALAGEVREELVAKDPHCAVCGSFA